MTTDTHLKGSYPFEAVVKGGEILELKINGSAFKKDSTCIDGRPIKNCFILEAFPFEIIIIPTQPGRVDRGHTALLYLTRLRIGTFHDEVPHVLLRKVSQHIREKMDELQSWL